MILNYGYRDASGDYFISIDTRKCDGCGKCVNVCPVGILEMSFTFDPELLEECNIPSIKPEHSKRLRYSCSPCKPIGSKASRTPSCIQACPRSAIWHSW